MKENIKKLISDIQNNISVLENKSKTEIHDLKLYLEQLTSLIRLIKMNKVDRYCIITQLDNLKTQIEKDLQKYKTT